MDTDDKFKETETHEYFHTRNLRRYMNIFVLVGELVHFSYIFITFKLYVHFKNHLIFLI
jgi:hypothetical protein